MVTKTEVSLKNFIVFNSKLGSKEGEEQKKILYYHPVTDSTEVQIKNVGLVEGIIQFTQTFRPSSPVDSFHTLKLRQLYFQPEKDYWMVMTLNLPILTKPRDGMNNSEQILEDDVQDNIYRALLEQCYYTFRLLRNSFENTKDTLTLRVNLEDFFNSYLKNIDFENADILSLFDGIQYLPLDTMTFLKVKSFINLMESKFTNIQYTAFLYNEHLIWSDLEPSQMQHVYNYLINTLLPSHSDKITASLSPSSPFVGLQEGRFITGPSNLNLAKTVSDIPKAYLFANDVNQEHHMMIYKALGAVVCLFLKSDANSSLESLKELDQFMKPNVLSLVNFISKYCNKQQVPPYVMPDTTPKFIYFNKLNLAYKSTVHANRQSGQVACSKDSLKIMADIDSHCHGLGYAGETIVKTMNDYWVVGKTSNCRKFFIALQQRNASLIDISEEVQRLCETELKGIFFHPM